MTLHLVVLYGRGGVLSNFCAKNRHPDLAFNDSWLAPAIQLHDSEPVCDLNKADMVQKANMEDLLDLKS